jgi:hypothetical protein
LLKYYDGDELLGSTVKAVEPSAAARARADEILAAFDKWNVNGKPPRGYRKAVREQDKARKVWDRIEIQICDTRASTMEGMIAKFRCARAYEGWEHEDVEDGPPRRMALSIMGDLEVLAKAV